MSEAIASGELQSIRIVPAWASGKRGLPRQRIIRFRAHGWGFVGGPNDTESVNLPSGLVTINVPPSAKSGMVSPRYGRFEVGGGYKGEVVAPNGADFRASTKRKPGGLKMLTRVKAATLRLSAAMGRFWRAAGIDDAANLLPQISGQPAPYFFETWFFLPGAAGYPANGIAMALLPEMYNALAQAVNSVTSGTPLQWQCLRFNVNGFIMGLDPTQAGPSGYTGSGAAGSAPGGGGFAYYNGPKPVNQFCSFDANSLFETLCNQLKIPVRTEKDFPGGMDGTGKDAAFSYLQQKITAPAIYADFVTAKSNGDTGCLPADETLLPTDPSGRGVDQFSGTLNLSISTELLSTVAVLQGQATGSHCLGTYDPAQWSLGGLSFPGFDPLPAYPDFTNAPPGAYYIANDGSGRVATASGQQSLFGNVLWGYPNPTNPVDTSLLLADWATVGTYSSPKGIASYPGNELYMAWGYGISGGVNLNAFGAYRWVEIEDVQRVVTSYGFPFIWQEIVTPLELKYFEEPTEQSIIADQSNVMAPWSANTFNYAGDISPFPINVRAAYWQTSGQDWMAYEIASINALTASSISFSNANAVSPGYGIPGHGTLLKFCPSADSKRAKWKIAPFPAPTQTPLHGRPVEICNLSSRSWLSPLFRYLTATAGVGLTGPYYLSSGPMTQWTPGISLLPASFSLGQRPSAATDVAQLVAQYTGQTDAQFSDLIATNYNEDTLLDRVQVLGFNIYVSQPLAPLPVLLSGIAGWRKQKDWWGTLDAAYAVAGYYYTPNNQSVPWQFMPPPPSLTFQVTENGLTILNAAADERYWCCFDLAVTISLN